MTYSEKLKSPRWQKKRLEILERDNFTCLSCGDRESTLHVHHSYYEKGKSPWDYPSESLSTQCEKCHEKIEALLAKIRVAIGGRMELCRKAERLVGALTEDLERFGHFTEAVKAIAELLDDWDLYGADEQSCSEAMFTINTAIVYQQIRAEEEYMKHLKSNENPNNQA